MMGYTIRPMTIGDHAEAYRLWEQADGICLGEEDAPAAIEIYLRHNEGLCFVACDNQRIIGAVLCGNDGRRGVLRHLVVNPEYRKQGVARALIRQCLDALARAGIRRCNTFVMDANNSGLRFWQHMGWRTITYDYRTMQTQTQPTC
jgi:ribosomal protein S18 acetylase RimI-like enzyme